MASLQVVSVARDSLLAARRSPGDTANAVYKQSCCKAAKPAPTHACRHASPAAAAGMGALAALAVLAQCQPGLAAVGSAFYGPARVVDGDTLVVAQQRIRM